MLHLKVIFALYQLASARDQALVARRVLGIPVLGVRYRDNECSLDRQAA